MKKHNVLSLHPCRTWIFLAGGLLLTALLALLFGGTALTPTEVLEGLLGRGDRTLSVIMRQIRLPRIIAGILAGVGLSISGVLLQSVTDNSLAGPNVIGVNSGAGLAVILLLAFCPTAIGALPFAACFGAFLATVFILSIANRFESSGVTVILVGVALTSILNAVISLISLLDADVLLSYHDFSVGGLQGVQMEQLALPAILILGAFVGAMLLSHSLEVLRLGDGTAFALGIRVRQVRIAALLCASASAAAVVSFAGLLGFVGLIVPHLSRRLVGESVKCLLPTAALSGGILVLLADLLGRTLFAPTELPVGIITSLIGAPFFLGLLFRRCHRA